MILELGLNKVKITVYFYIYLVYSIVAETKQLEAGKMKTMTMTITLEIKEGEQAVFKIQFKDSDFMNVIDSIDDVTIDNVFNQELFTVI